MNERIRELKNQTLDKHFSYTWSKMDYDDVTKFAEKFAELIVQECLNQCYYRGMNDELYAGQLKAAAYIEQHFGVEE